MTTLLRYLAARVEGVTLVLIVLTVAGFAAAASFTHVHDWTMRHSPHGTPDWFGWANAAISELVPTACALVIRRRRRTGQGVGYPATVLVAAVALSLAAQLAVAQPSPSGWLLSAVPCLAFIALTKLVLSTKPVPAPPAAPAAAVSTVDVPAVAVAVSALAEQAAVSVAPVGSRSAGVIGAGVVR